MYSAHDSVSVIIASDVGIFSNPVNDVRTTDLISNGDATGWLHVTLCIGPCVITIRCGV